MQSSTNEMRVETTCVDFWSACYYHIYYRLMVFLKLAQLYHSANSFIAESPLLFLRKFFGFKKMAHKNDLAIKWVSKVTVMPLCTEWVLLQSNSIHYNDKKGASNWPVRKYINQLQDLNVCGSATSVLQQSNVNHS